MKANSKLEKLNKIEVPHIYVILFIMIFLATIASYIVPSGKFDRATTDTGAEALQPGTFKFIESTPVGIQDFMLSISTGLIQSAEIIFGILAIGGVFAVLEKTGIIEIGVSRMANLFSNKGLWVIPALMIPFALFTTFTGQVELTLVYVPLIMPLVLKLGFDKLTAVAIALVATIAGFTVALTAPANLGTAQLIAEVPLYSGLLYRIIIFAIILTVGILFVWRYAKKIKKDPEKSMVYGEDNGYGDEIKLDKFTATKRQFIASLFLIPAFGVFLIGLLQYQWYFKELIGLYVIIGIVVGLIAGLGLSQIAEAFQTGFNRMLLGALLVGVARIISVVLEDGQIMDTIIYGFENIVSSVPNSITSIIMLGVQGTLNFLIPSGSGQAMVTMPIMAGISDLTDVSRQTTVLAFLFGDGFSNIIYPTSGAFMATLVVGKVTWTKWLKFIFPLIAIWYGLAVIFLIIAQVIGY